MDEAFPPLHEPPLAEWSIDELARQAGSTVRNVRLYQERGLLPKPRRRGRRAIYDRAHLDRLKLILDLLERGYPIAAIKELIDAWESQRGLGDVLGFSNSVTQFEIEEPAPITMDDIIGLFPQSTPETFERALELGLMQPDGEGYIAPVPTLFRAGAQLAADGVPLEATLEVAAEIIATTEHLADVLVRMFKEHVWDPFEAAGFPPEQAERVTAAIQRQRPLATSTVVAALGHALQQKVDEMFAGADVSGMA